MNESPPDVRAEAEFQRLLLAAERGDPRSQEALGRCYFFGHGTQPDPKYAVHWFRQSACHGNLDAHSALGVCYQTGQGAETDLVKASAHLQYAAAGGHPGAMDLLDCLYQKALDAHDEVGLKLWRPPPDWGRYDGEGVSNCSRRRYRLGVTICHSL